MISRGWRLTQFSNVRRSSPVSTSGSSLVAAILPAQLTRSQALGPGPELGHKTTHVVTTELKTGSLADVGHRFQADRAQRMPTRRNAERVAGWVTPVIGALLTHSSQVMPAFWLLADA